MYRWTAPAQAFHRPCRLANVVACGRGCHAAAGAADRRRQHPGHRCIATARTGWLAGRRKSSREVEEPGKAQGMLGANRHNYKCWCWRNELRNKLVACALSVLIVQGDYVAEQSGSNSANITMQLGLSVWVAQVPSKSKLALHALKCRAKHTSVNLYVLGRIRHTAVWTLRCPCITGPNRTSV